MKRKTFLSWLFLLLLTPIGAYAADQLTDVKITPDPATEQRELTKIELQFSDANYGLYGKVETENITLTRKGSTEVLYALPDPAINSTMVTLEFAYKGETTPATATTAGTYTLHVPAGAIMGMNPRIPNAEINVDFTVNPATQTDMSRYTLNPVPGPVNQISSIELGFPDSKGLDWFYNNLFGKIDLSSITLTDKNNPAVKYTAVKKKFDNNYTITFGFVNGSEEITVTTPGTYLLHIPAGLFQKDYTSVKNDDIDVEYTIALGQPAEFQNYILNPADGSSIGQLYQMSFTFPKLTTGMDFPVNKVGEITILTPSGETYYGFNAQVASAEGGSYNQLSVNFAPKDAYSIESAITFTAAGKYTVTMPEGVVKAYGKDVTNGKITASFTVDPQLNFTYNITPSSDTYHDSFVPLTVTRGSSLTTLSVRPNTGLNAVIAKGETSYKLFATQTDSATVTLVTPDYAKPSAGDWTVTIPARYFTGKDKQGVTITNRDAITFLYRIKTAEEFQFTVNPGNGDTISVFKNLTLLFEGNNLKRLELTSEAGQPVIINQNDTINLTGRISAKYAIFEIPGGANLKNGKYTVKIPAGYIKTVDANNLTAEVPALTTTFTILNDSVSDFTKGILFLNEGWFGHDPGSINFYGNNGKWTYDAYQLKNPTHKLGITSQYGDVFGDNIYVVSKQADGTEAESGGIFTVIDAKTMAFKGQISALPSNLSGNQPRAFCAWDEHKGYLSTQKAIYTVDLDSLKLGSIVPGSDKFTSFNTNGEMLRYGNYIFAMRKSEGVDAIDPATDKVVTIPAELASGFAILPNGNFIVATQSESNEFIRISPTTLTVEEHYDIDADYSKITNSWTTWRKAPIAASTTLNRVYYVNTRSTQGYVAGPRTVACYDFDKKQYTENFITLPGTADGEAADWVLYGEGVSVDPKTGLVMLSAVETGYGAHYKKNRVFMADPATGAILKDRTLVLDDNYWFPAMTMYPDFEAPSIDTIGLSLPNRIGDKVFDLSARTSLSVGNRHLIVYSVKSLNEDICTVTPLNNYGQYMLSVLKKKTEYSLELTADYRGRKTTLVYIAKNDVGVDEVTNEDVPLTVYNLQGIVVLRNATLEELYRLPAGIYIANGRKYFVK